jgi:signal transduction histidine kinase
MKLSAQSRGRNDAAATALAIEQERRRLADELHDGVIQQLVLACILIDQARLEQSCDRLERARSLLDDALEQLRSMMLARTPALVRRAGLCQAIERLAEYLGQRWGLTYRCRVRGDPVPLPEAISEALFQGTRELMTNVGRHARASRCDVSVEVGDRYLEVAVSDDGIGIEPGRAAARVPGLDGGFGLFSLRSRVEDLGGELHVGPGHGGGTRATLRLPLPGPVSAER